MSILNPGRVPDRYAIGSIDNTQLDDLMTNQDSGVVDEQPSYETPDYGLPGTMNRLVEFINSDNVAALIPSDRLEEIGKQVIDDYQLDKDSCADWYSANTKALDLARQKGVSKSFPWEGAANVVVPLITTASIAYNARVLPEIITQGGIALTRTMGRQTPEKDARAERVAEHINYQLLFQMREWQADTDKLLMVYSVCGLAYRKIWFDTIKNRPCSTILTPDQVVVNNSIQSLESARRVSHIIEMYKNDIESKKRAGLWLDVECAEDGYGGEATSENPTDDPVYVFIEQHRWLDLDDDGYEEPYIVTVDKGSSKVVRIMARYDERDVKHKDDGTVVSIDACSYFIDYHFIPTFDGTFMSYGFGALLGNLNRASNSVLNALLNAGLLSNTQGGFLAKNFRMQGGNKPLAAGEWRKTEIPADLLQNSLLPMPVKEPSAVLQTLLEQLIGMAKSIVSVQSIGLDDVPANAAASSVLSVVEDKSKVFNATFKRFYRSLTDELRLLCSINSRYLGDVTEFVGLDKESQITRDDYAANDYQIIPVADPAITTQAQRMAIANSTLEVAKAVPGSNLVEAGRDVLKAIGNPDPDKIIAPSGAQTIPPEVQQQMAAMQQQAAQMQQMLTQAGQEMAMLNVLLANKDKENAIKAFEAHSKSDVNRTVAIKNLAEAKAKGDAAAIARLEAEVSASEAMSESLEAIINAGNNRTGSAGMAGASSNGSASQATG